MKIAILRESDEHKDKRVALTPVDAKLLIQRFPGLIIQVQSSNNRAFTNEEYINAGINIKEEVSDCDLLIGVKKVNTENIIPGKTYLFFAHVAKKQENNREYLKYLVKNKVTLIDYEYLKNENGKRLAAFGYIAGVAGAYYVYDMLSKKINKTFLSKVSSSGNIIQAIINSNLKKPCKIALSGNGNVANGVSDIFNAAGINQVNSHSFINKSFGKTVFCKLQPEDYLINKRGIEYSAQHYRQNPEQYRSKLAQFINIADAYVACHYWHKNYPKYLSTSDLKNEQSNLKVIADISCDLNGSVAPTLRETSFNNPYFDYNPITGNEESPFSSGKNITVMAIGNLPSLLPREASEGFSRSMADVILPQYIENTQSFLFKNATILKCGNLTKSFSYLTNYLNSNSYV
jgi:alanine dehydrogenase